MADGVSGRTHASAYLRVLPPPVTRPRQDGVGTVTFGEPAGLLGVTRAKPPQVIVLAAVPEAERVRDLIARAQTAA